MLRASRTSPSRLVTGIRGLREVGLTSSLAAARGGSVGRGLARCPPRAASSVRHPDVAVWPRDGLDMRMTLVLACGRVAPRATKPKLNPNPTRITALKGGLIKIQPVKP